MYILILFNFFFSDVRSIICVSVFPYLFKIKVNRCFLIRYTWCPAAWQTDIHFNQNFDFFFYIIFTSDFDQNKCHLLVLLNKIVDIYFYWSLSCVEMWILLNNICMNIFCSSILWICREVCVSVQASYNFKTIRLITSITGAILYLW